MKSNRAQQKKLNTFIEGLINAKILTGAVIPLLALDTTSVPTLREIKHQTKDDMTADGRILYETSSKLLNIFSQSQKYYQDVEYRQFPQNAQRVHIQKGKKIETIERKVERSKKDLNILNQKEFLLFDNQNNENKNTINIQRKDKSQQKNIHNPRHINVDCKLVEIIRPEYKKSQVGKKIPQILDDNQAPSQMRNNRTYVTQSSDSEDIPIVRNKMKSHRQINNKLKRRSVSPKHESRNLNHQLINISAISKNYQTQTDHSFEIDLYGMGFVAEKPKVDEKPLHHVYLIKGRSGVKDKVNQFQIVKRTETVQSSGIQQQQPWECDEEQIEEQIRQIDQKLRYKAYYTQRTKTQSEDKKLKRNF